MSIFLGIFSSAPRQKIPRNQATIALEASSELPKALGSEFRMTENEGTLPEVDVANNLDRSSIMKKRNAASK